MRSEWSEPRALSSLLSVAGESVRVLHAPFLCRLLLGLALGDAFRFLSFPFGNFVLELSLGLLAGWLLLLRLTYFPKSKKFVISRFVVVSS